MKREKRLNFVSSKLYSVFPGAIEKNARHIKMSNGNVSSVVINEDDFRWDEGSKSFIDDWEYDYVQALIEKYLFKYEKIFITHNPTVLKILEDLGICITALIPNIKKSDRISYVQVMDECGYDQEFVSVVLENWDTILDDMLRYARHYLPMTLGSDCTTIVDDLDSSIDIVDENGGHSNE